jgi:hypothetical protein
MSSKLKKKSPPHSDKKRGRQRKVKRRVKDGNRERKTGKMWREESGEE